MRKLAIVSTLIASTLPMMVTTADARPWGRGYYGGGYGYNGGYGYRRRGIGTGAAIGLGIAGLAAGAIAAGAARDAYYRNGYGPGYGYYGRPSGYGYYGY